MDEVNVAVIGAGIAGLTCASELARADAKVTVFERSRGLGGRLATRRAGDFAFDHGAQFLTARSRPFVKYVESAQRSGVLDTWTPRVREDERDFDAPFDSWYVGRPGMSALVRPLTRGVNLQLGVRVLELVQGRRGWELRTDSGKESRVFDAVAVAVPAPQALTLLGPHGRAFSQLMRVEMAPCWTAMIAFEQPTGIETDARRWTQGAIGWAANDSSKPGRTQAHESWVVHASPRWTREHLEADAQEAARLLLHEFANALGASLPKPVYLQAHRWRHSFVETPLGLPCLVDEEIAAGTCGDWCVAPRVEAAFESGRTLALSLTSMLGLAASSLLR